MTSQRLGPLQMRLLAVTLPSEAAWSGAAQFRALNAAERGSDNARPPARPTSSAAQKRARQSSGHRGVTSGRDEIDGSSVKLPLLICVPVIECRFSGFGTLVSPLAQPGSEAEQSVLPHLFWACYDP